MKNEKNNEVVTTTTLNHYKTLGDILRKCTVVGRVIVLPSVGFEDNFRKYDTSLFIALKILMRKNGGEYYPSDKNRGFVFRDFNAQSKETETLLNKMIEENK